MTHYCMYDYEGKPYDVDISKKLGTLTAPQGIINLVSVASKTEVKLGNTDVDVSLLTQYGDIHILDKSLLDVSGEGVGNIFMCGKNILVRDSAIQADTLGAVNGGMINIFGENISFIKGSRISLITYGSGSGSELNMNALQDITFSIDKDNQKHSGNYIFPKTLAEEIYYRQTPLPTFFGGIASISANIDDNGGDSGQISIQSKNLIFSNGARIIGSTYGGGKGSDINIIAKENIRFFGSNFYDDGSAIFIETHGISFNAGFGGNILMVANDIFFENGAAIDAFTFGNGNSGLIKLKARNIISFSGNNKDKYALFFLLHFFRSVFNKSYGGIVGVTLPFSNGNGSEISIESNEILLFDGNIIDSSTFGSGKGGNITIQVNEGLIIDGAFAYGDLCSQIGTSSFSIGNYNSGNAGNIIINAKNLVLNNGSSIHSSSNWSYGNLCGNAGNIYLNITENITISGVNQYGEEHFGITGRSGIYAESYGLNNTGNSGNIAIKSGSLIITNGGIITCNTNTNKPGGVIDIQVRNKIYISGDASDELYIPNDLGLKIEQDSGIYSSSVGQATESGASGKISISAESLSIENKGTISTSNEGGGNAGDIIFTGKDLLLTNNASISSSSNHKIHGGAAGTISIQTEDSIRVINNSRLSTEAVNMATDNIDDALSGKISLAPKKLLYLYNSDITTSVKGGSGNGGDIEISLAKFVALNKSNIIANSYEGSGGNIHIGAKNLIQSVDSKISASSQLGLDGNIQVDAPDVDFNSGLSTLQTSFLNASQWAQTPCAERSGEQVSRFIMSYRDATPTDVDDLFASPPIDFGYFSHEKPGFDIANILDLLNKGNKHYKGGNIESAIQQWETVLSKLNQDRDVGLFLSTVERLNHAFQEIGYHKKAINLFQQAAPVLKQTTYPHRKILFYSNLGDLQLCMGLHHEAFKSFKKVSAQSAKLNDSIVYASLLNNVANALLSIGRYKKAMEIYTKAFKRIDQFQNSNPLQAAILINMLTAKMQIDTYEIIKNSFDTALLQVKKLSDDHIKSNYLISLGLKAKYLTEYFPDHKEPFIQMARSLLDESSTIAHQSLDYRLLSKSAGYKAQINELNQQHLKAAKNTKKAIFYADQGNYLALQYRWQHQLGRLYKTIGENDHAIQCFENAIKMLSKIRNEIFTGYRFYKDVFNEKIRPAYQELASLYIDRAEKTSKKASKQHYLKRAITVMENLKTAELQDYFEDECVAKNQNKSDLLAHVPERNALIYPISLSKRLVILLAISDKIKHFSTKIAKKDFDQTVKLFRRQLQSRISYDFLENAKKLYSYIIFPVESTLKASNIETLLVVSGGALRLIPLSTLHNGKSFLVESYAIASLPALSLTDNQGKKLQTNKVLLGGLSKSVQGFASLPSVKKEIHDLQKIIKSNTIFLNEEYTVENISKEIKDNNYTIVHLATHGEFGGTARDSFLLTYDDKLDMNQLETVLSAGKYKNKPVELLTLSACQTALGNERASLGLAGIAVKAGVKTAIATLWYVDDEATSLAVKELYRQLTHPGITRAKALQNAQKMMISQKKYWHPIYWGPFLLIGSWG